MIIIGHWFDTPAESQTAGSRLGSESRGMWRGGKDYKKTLCPGKKWDLHPSSLLKKRAESLQRGKENKPSKYLLSTMQGGGEKLVQWRWYLVEPEDSSQTEKDPCVHGGVIKGGGPASTSCII